MHRGGFLETFVLFLSGLQVSTSLQNVTLEIEPGVVHHGEDSIVKCSYDLQDAPLYCVKWYRGTREFYRYTPKELPSTKIFPYPGVHVDLKQSNEKQVVLQQVGFSLSGTFSCEITTDAPLFLTAHASKDMVVVEYPDNPPTMITEKNSYEIGDILRANCSSPPARPPASLNFFLNNGAVCERCQTHKYASGELLWSEQSLELPLFPSHFNHGRLTLECVAEIENLYRKNVQIILYNVKDPIPARVTQNLTVWSCASSLTIVLLVFFVSFLF